MSVEANKHIARQIHQALMVERNREALAALIHPTFIDHTMPDNQGSLDSYVQAFDTYFQAFPDFAVTIDDLTGEDDLIVVRMGLSGTHQGDFYGAAPSGKSFKVDGLQFYRIRDGKVGEIWGYVDIVGLRNQLGIQN